MKKVFYATLALGALILASCQKENSVNGPKVESPVFTAYIDTDAPAGQPETKTVLKGNKSEWESGDAIRVLNGTNTKGCDAVYTTTDNGASATFTTTVDGFTGSQFIAMYPASEANYAWWNADKDKTVNKLWLKDKQDAVEGGYDPTAHIAVAYTDKNSFVFKNVVALLKFRVIGPGVEKISVLADKIAGNFSYNTETGAVSKDDNDYTKLSTVTLSGTFTDGKDYYIAVLPGTYSTLKLKVNDRVYKSKAESSEFAAGTIYDLGEIKFEEYVPETLYLVGDATVAGWDCNNPVVLQKNDKVFSVETYLDSAEGLQGFKFITTIGSFDYCVLNAGDNRSISYKEFYQDEDDRKFTVSHFGLYLIEVDFNTKTLRLSERAPYLVSDFTSYHFGADSEPLQLKATGKEGEFKAQRVFIWNKSYVDGGETKYCTNEYKFAFKKTDGEDIDYSFSIQPDNDKTYEIAMGEEYYENGNSKKDILKKTLKARLVGQVGNIDDYANGGVDYKWMVKGSYNHKYYDITLNLKDMTMSIELSQGQDFYLVGINGLWSNLAPKATAENGVATWTVDVNTDNWDGTFKICGVNTTDNFWDGEWYNAQLDNNGAWWWKEDNYGTETPVLFENLGNHERKWKMTESGNYTFVFDSKKLTLKVSKNS